MLSRNAEVTSRGSSVLRCILVLKYLSAYRSPRRSQRSRQTGRGYDVKVL